MAVTCPENEHPLNHFPWSQHPFIVHPSWYFVRLSVRVKSPHASFVNRTFNWTFSKNVYLFVCVCVCVCVRACVRARARARAHCHSLFRRLIYPNDIMGVDRFVMRCVLGLDMDAANDRDECIISEGTLKFRRFFARAADHNEGTQNHVYPRRWN